jgi:hypothetical protein
MVKVILSFGNERVDLRSELTDMNVAGRKTVPRNAITFMTDESRLALIAI